MIIIIKSKIAVNTFALVFRIISHTRIIKSKHMNIWGTCDIECEVEPEWLFWLMQKCTYELRVPIPFHPLLLVRLNHFHSYSPQSP